MLFVTYKLFYLFTGTLSNHRRLKHKIVNKRKTLAETTPESILAAAEVAGKSRRRVKPNTDSNLNSASLQRYYILTYASLIYYLPEHKQLYVL